eukprot:gene17857-21290_t
MTKIYTCLCLFLFVITLSASAQLNSIINGKICETSAKPLEFVNVVLRDGHNKVIGHEVSDAKGLFKFINLSPGNYHITCSLVGYNDYQTPLFTLDNGQTRTEPLIFMTADQKILKEVEISTKKAIFSNSIDRKVYNVDMDISSKSGSATEVLQNVPLVQVDIDGNVSLRNSSVMILINGKESPLMGKNAAAALQQLPANSIDKIEVITNPSAKYKPDGTGGIINIILKKNTKRGLNGNVTANAGNNERYNASTALNYNTGKLNLFGSYSVKQDDRLRNISNTRIQTDPKTLAVNHYNDYTIAKSRPFSNIATLGLDYNLDDKNSFGLSGNYYLREMHKHDVILKQVESIKNGNQDYDRKRENFEQETLSSATVYYEHQFTKENHRIRLEFNIDHKPEVEDNHYTNTYRYPLIPNQMDNTVIQQTANNKHVNLNYENPLNKNNKLEAGYDGQFNSQDQDFYVSAFDQAKQAFITDLQKTNRFIYHENIHAFYTTYTSQLKKFGILLGLRGEYTDLNSKLITTSEVIPNNYFKIYPTLHLTYRINEQKELQLNYSRRVRRPEGDELNPFPEYADPTNVKVGNPYLLPEIIHSVELGYQWKKNGISITPGIYYRYTYNRFTAVTLPLNDSVLVTKQQNLANDKAFGADLVISGNLNDKLNVNLTPNLFYNQIDASNLGYSSKKSTITWSANLNTSYALNKGTSLQLNSIYKSARLTPQGEYLPVFIMNLGARQEIFSKKGAVYFTLSDVFKSLKQETDLQGPYLVQHILSRNNSRIFYLGMSYNFGGMKKKKDMQFDNSL